MRWLAGILLLTLLGLQYRLWVGDGSLGEVQALRDEIAVQKVELKEMRARNQVMEAEVRDLHEGLDALEERARSELGMIKQGEMFLQVIEEEPDAPVDSKPLPEGASNAKEPQAKEDADLAEREAGVAKGRAQ